MWKKLMVTTKVCVNWKSLSFVSECKTFHVTSSEYFNECSAVHICIFPHISDRASGLFKQFFFVHIYNFPICFFEMNLRGTSKTKIDGIFALLNDVWKFNTWWKSSKKLCHRGTLVQILMLKGNDFVRFKVYKISCKQVSFFFDQGEIG